MKKIELLSPVGNMDCMRAAVQNGADTASVRPAVLAEDSG